MTESRAIKRGFRLGHKSVYIRLIGTEAEGAPEILLRAPSVGAPELL